MFADKFLQGTNYKRTFEDEVTTLTETDLPIRWRLKAVEELTEAYFQQTKELPENDQLTRLADYILKDDLTDKHPDKVTKTDFPIFSDGQMKLRLKRERASDLTNFSADKKHRLNGKKATNYQSQNK